MKVGEFDIMITSAVDEDELAAEIWKYETKTRSHELGSVHIKNGKPTIHLGPDPKSETGAWVLEYRTFKKIVAALDDFLASVGYSDDGEG